MTSNSPKPLALLEFIPLMALMMGIIALTANAMLPALPEIGRSLGVKSENDVQLVISGLFLGMAIGQLFYGIIADSFGRKTSVYIGMGIFISGSLICIYAPDFPYMIAGRILQGIGLGAPRVVYVALVRDQYQGVEMARLMSMVFTVTVLVPMISPAFGQMVISIAGWHSVFWAILLIGIVMLCWFGLRQPETLTEKNRRPFTLKGIRLAFIEVLREPVCIVYTALSGFCMGAFLSYQSQIQQILDLQYHMADAFPTIFAALAFFVGSAAYLNSRLVSRFGIRSIVHCSLSMSLIVSCGFGLVAVAYLGTPPLSVLLGYFAVMLFGMGLLFGNVSSLAMESLGHVAGTGSSVVSTLSTLVSVVYGAAVARFYDLTVFPVLLGFGGAAGIGLILMGWVKRRLVMSADRLE